MLGLFYKFNKPIWLTNLVLNNKYEGRNTDEERN